MAAVLASGVVVLRVAGPAVGVAGHVDVDSQVATLISPADLIVAVT